MKKRILALSSSRVGTGGYLEAAVAPIKRLLGENPIKVAFVPFASVDPDHSAYTNMVCNGLSSLPYQISTVTKENAVRSISEAEAIMIGGGNTFKLLHDLYESAVMNVIKEKISQGTPYVGWSAGSNITGATICTTNDMPIINPGSFDALGFFPFQINPHYYNLPVSGFNGETRDQRLTEFLQLNPIKRIVALPEGTALLMEDEKLSLIGNEAWLLEWKEAALIKQL